MRDPRITQLADGLINYSVELKRGERVLIENFGVEEALVEALVEKAYEAGGASVRLTERESHFA